MGHARLAAAEFLRVGPETAKLFHSLLFNLVFNQSISPGYADS